LAFCEQLRALNIKFVLTQKRGSLPPSTSLQTEFSAVTYLAAGQAM